MGEQYLGNPCCRDFLQDVPNGHLQGGVPHEPGSCPEGVQRLIELICAILKVWAPPHVPFVTTVTEHERLIKWPHVNVPLC